MGIPEFVDTVSDQMRARIGAELDRIEREHDVRILFAVESGSRAWGFPSPDSDYDVRFVYAHPVDWYLSLEPGRDVIELPLEGELDINGWDIRKALQLLKKPNPVALEWLSSPIRYRWTGDVCAKVIAFAARTAPASACLHHYLRLGEGQMTRSLGDASEVNLKKYAYVLRPALAIRWIRLRPETAPPMNLQDLAAGLDLDAVVLADIARLLELKSRARETGLGPRIASLDALIEAEFAWARAQTLHAQRPDLAVEADALFRDIVNGHPGE